MHIDAFVLVMTPDFRKIDHLSISFLNPFNSDLPN